MNPFTKNPNVPLYCVPEPSKRWALRKHDMHLGTDIHLPAGEEVILPRFSKHPMTNIFVEKSWEVVRVENFTGPNSVPPTPWWNDTQAVMIRNGVFVHVLGEIETSLKVGQRIKEGDVVGRIKPVLKKANGMPNSMLHYECWRVGAWDMLEKNYGAIPYSSFSLEHPHGMYKLVVQQKFPNSPPPKSLTSNQSIGGNSWMLDLVKAMASADVAGVLASKNYEYYLADKDAEKLLKPGMVYNPKVPMQAYFRHDGFAESLWNFMYGTIEDEGNPGARRVPTITETDKLIFLGTTPWEDHPNGTSLRFLRTGDNPKVILFHGSFRASHLFEEVQ